MRRRDPLRPRSLTRLALRAGTNFQARHPAKIKATLRRQAHPGRAFPCRLKGAVFLRQFLLYKDSFVLLKLASGGASRAAGWESRQRIQEVLMKKLFPASFRIVSSLFAKTHPPKPYR